ncbi:sulfatase family protein [Paenibacillus ferrarius]|uniref:sulfatase family protein n=1 Tax=Paenibacillus ferrarius TaxID=1469647 RepID=UPI003D2905E0
MQAHGQKNPNILFIHTDQQRADSLACYGNRVVRTPHLDQLAREGVLFENAHCTHPLCMPSRATLLTGRYNRAHKLYRNGIPLNPEEMTIAELLKQQGYRTGLIGKAHFTPYAGDPTLHPEAVQVNNGVSTEDCWNYWSEFQGPYYGFDHVQMSMGHGSYGMYGGHYGLWVHREHPEQVRLFAQNAALEPTDPRYPSWKSAVPLAIHSSTWITEKTIEFIEGAGHHPDQPFYGWIGFQEPHEPFNPPKPYCDMYLPEDMPLPARRAREWGEQPPGHVAHYLNRGHWGMVPEEKEREIIAHYYGNVTLVDDCIGRIVAALKRRGLYENTVIVFTSDHGEWLGDHGLWLKGAVHTRGLTRVPFIVRWPGVAEEGRRVKAIASLIDVMPTLLDAAGAVPLPYGVQGTSLRKVSAGEMESNRGYALIEHRHEPYQLNRELEGEALVINKTSNEFHMKTIITDRYRFTYMPGYDYAECFDLEKDPEELYNLWPDSLEAGVRERLYQRMLDALIETEDPLPRRKWIV